MNLLLMVFKKYSLEYSDILRLSVIKVSNGLMDYLICLNRLSLNRWLRIVT